MKKVVSAMRYRRQENAVSLLDQVPVARTCRSAGVAVHWCMCTYTQPVPRPEFDVGTSEWQLTAAWVVFHINHLLRPAIADQLCQPVALTRLVNAFYIIPTDLVCIFVV